MFRERQILDILIGRLDANPSVRSNIYRAESITWKGKSFPIDVIELGSDNIDHPCIGFFSGVHGMERIGTQVILAFLQSLTERLQWDDSLINLLTQVKLLFMPIVNPVGIFMHSRCNGNNVDLMRNAPINAEVNVPFLVGGHRLGKALPWYRGKKNADMEAESQALINTVNQRIIPHKKAITIDCHSGFGLNDRLWFPFAYSARPFPLLAEVTALKNTLDKSYPYHHFYHIEPQSNAYHTHGDLWDYLSVENEGRDFIPLTLEMGSWLWLKKNPKQIFDIFGVYHPIQEHRIKRVLRQHMPLLDFLIRMTASHKYWWPNTTRARKTLENEAFELWFRKVS
ncbi:hypothetical protein A9Q99_06855 [Gammaproteobacteria bacterium 45_16_T64]|nr:hypothetical protein A9Q99_06855 [Gammaproteobacteria bacterium 45_16_T64]